MSDLLTELQNDRLLRDTRLMQTLDRAQDDITSKRYNNPLSREFWNLKRDIGDAFRRDSEVTLSLDDFNALRNLPTIKRNYWKGGAEFDTQSGKGSGFDGSYNSAYDFVNNFNVKDVTVDGDGRVVLKFTDEASGDAFNEAMSISRANLKKSDSSYNLGTYANPNKGYYAEDIEDAKDIKLEERKQKLLDEMEDLKEGSDSRINRLLDLKEKTKMKELDIIGGASGFDANSLIRNILNRVNAGNRGSSLPTQIRIGQ